jgi:hypothetical protein
MLKRIAAALAGAVALIAAGAGIATGPAAAQPCPSGYFSNPSVGGYCTPIPNGQPRPGGGLGSGPDNTRCTAGMYSPEPGVCLPMPPPYGQ